MTNTKAAGRASSLGDFGADAYRRTQRDFLNLHIAVWMPRFVDSLEKRCGGAETVKFYQVAANALLE